MPTNGNSVDYIIRLVADHSDLKKKLSAGELLTQSDMKKISKLLTSAIQEATGEADKLKDALKKSSDVDTTKLEKATKFLSGVFKELEHTGNPMVDWAKEGEKVFKSFNKLQDTTRSLSKDMGGIRSEVESLKTSFKEFEKTYQAINPGQFGNMVKDAEQVSSIVVKLNDMLERLGQNIGNLDALDKYKKRLESITGQEYKINMATDLPGLEKNLQTAQKLVNRYRLEVTNLNTEISQDPGNKELYSQLKQAQREYAKYLIALQDIDKKRVDLRAKSVFHTNIGGMGSLKAIKNETTRLLDELELGLLQNSQNLTKIQLDLKLPEFSGFVKDINAYVSKVNESKTIKPIEIKTSIVGDLANPAAQLKKRKKDVESAAGDSILGSWATTLAKSFKSLETIVFGGQNKIFDKTKEWRKKMLEQLSFGAQDLNFEWNQDIASQVKDLHESLQAYFELHPIDVKIDTEGLAEQLKLIIEKNGITLGGNVGSTSVDANTIANIAGSITKSILNKDSVIDDAPQNAGIDAESTNKAADSQQKYVKELDKTSIHIDKVIESLKKFALATNPKMDKDGNIIKDEHGNAKYHVSKAMLSMRNFLGGKGLNMSEIAKHAKDDTYDAEIIKMINDAFMTRMADGYARGSALPDALGRLLGNIDTSTKNGGIASALKDAFVELFNMNGIKTEYEAAKAKRLDGIDIAKTSIVAGKTIHALQKLLWSISEYNDTGKMPSSDTIQYVVDILRKYNVGNPKYVKDLEDLKIYRDTLDELIPHRETTYKQDVEDFKKASNALYNPLKNLADQLTLLHGQIETRVTLVDGRTEDIGSIRDTRRLPDDFVLSNAEIYKYIESMGGIDDSIVGSTKYREYSRRKAAAQERRMLYSQMRTSERAPYLSDRPADWKALNARSMVNAIAPQTGKVNILANEIVVDEFRPKGEAQYLGKGDLNSNISKFEKNKESYQRTLEENAKEIEELEKQIKIQKANVKRSKTQLDKTTPQFEGIDLTGYQQAERERSQRKPILDKFLEENIPYATKKQSPYFDEDDQKEISKFEKAAQKLYPELYKKTQELAEITKQREEVQKRILGFEKMTQEEAATRLRRLIDADARANDPSVRNSIFTSDQEWLAEYQHTPKEDRERVKARYEAFLYNPDALRADEDKILASLSEKEASVTAELTAMRDKELAALNAISGGDINTRQDVWNAYKKKADEMVQGLIDADKQISDANLPTKQKNELVAYIQNTWDSLQELTREFSSYAPTQQDANLMLERSEVVSLQEKYITNQPWVGDKRKNNYRKAQNTLDDLKRRKEQLTASNSDLQHQIDLTESSLDRYKTQKRIVELKEKELSLQKEINKMEEEGASEKKINAKKKSLNAVTSELASLDAKDGVNMQISKGNPVDKQIKDAIDAAKRYQAQEIQIKAQKYMAQREIARIDKKKEGIELYGLGAGEGREALNKKIRTLTDEYLKSPQVIEQEKALREKAKQAIAGGANSQEIWKQYHIDIQALRTKLTEEFLKTFKETDGTWKESFKKEILDPLLSGYTSVQDEYRSKYSADVLDPKIQFAQEQQKAAIDYIKGLKASDDRYKDIDVNSMLLNPEAVEQQVGYYKKLADLNDELIKKNDAKKSLEEAGVDKKNTNYKKVKQEISAIQEQINHYKSLIDNRKKLTKLDQQEKLSSEDKKLFALQNLKKAEDRLAASKQRVIELETAYNEAKGTDKETAALKRLNDEKERQIKYQRNVNKYKYKVDKWSQPDKTGETRATRTTKTSTVQGGILGEIVHAINESLSGVATQQTLHDIYQLLSGGKVAVVVDDHATPQKTQDEQVVAAIKQAELGVSQGIITKAEGKKYVEFAKSVAQGDDSDVSDEEEQILRDIAMKLQNVVVNAEGAFTTKQSEGKSNKRKTSSKEDIDPNIAKVKTDIVSTAKYFELLQARVLSAGLGGTTDWASHTGAYNDYLNYATSKQEKLNSGKRLHPKELEKFNKLSSGVATSSQAIQTQLAQIDQLTLKAQQYKAVISEAQEEGYLLKNGDAKFTAAEKALDSIIQKAENGEASLADILKAYKKLVNSGSDINKIINSNKKLYVGTSEIRGATRQRDRIRGSHAIDIESEENTEIIRRYNDAYKNLIKTYDEFVAKKKMSDPQVQEQLRQQAAGVQKLGRRTSTSLDEAEKLLQYVENSGTYTNKKGVEHDLGGIKSVSAEEIKNMEAAMRSYAKSVLGADLENVKFNSTKQMMTGTLRKNNQVVSDMVVKYNQATEAMYLYQEQEKESLAGWPAIMRGFKEKAKSILQYLASITSIYRVWGTIKQGVQYIKEIDAALTELKKVTDETTESYERFVDTAAKTADKVGSTIKEIVSSTADWARIGYSLEEASTLAETTAVLLNVSEFQSIDDATSALTSTLQAFSYTADQSMSVVDVLNEVGNNFAVSSDGIATALKDSASSLVAANNTYQEAVALIAAGNKVVQDPGSVGAALRTISLRLRGTSVTELTEAGEDTDGVVTTKSKLRSKVKGLTGVDILTDTGAYKSTYEIMLEISKVWDNLTDDKQAGVLEIIAGKTRSNTAAAILSNTEDLEAAFRAAQEAEGSALRENEKYLDSIQGRVDLFNNSIQTLWNNTIDSEVIKFIVDLGTELIKIVDNIGVFRVAIAGAFTYLSTKYFKMNWAHPIKSFKQLFGKPAADDINTVRHNLKQLETEYASAQQAFTQDPSKKNQQVLTATKNRLQEYQNINKSTIDFQKNLSNAQSELAKAQNRLDNYTGKNQNTIQVYTNSVNKAKAKVDELNQSQAQANQSGASAWQNLGNKASQYAAKIQSAISSMLVMYAISKVAQLIKDAWDKYIVTAEEAKEGFDDLTAALSSTELEIQNLESKLNDINDKIKEINENTPLTFTDEEELSRLKAESAELQRQIDLQNTLKKQQQLGVNEAAITSADLYSQTGVKTGKTKKENILDKTGNGALIGAGVGVATGIGGSILGGALAGTAMASWSGPIGMLIGAAIGAIAGAAIGATVGGIESASEETVGESLDGMRNQYEKLKEEYDMARANYTSDASEKNKKKFEEAEEAFTSYQSNMANYMVEMDSYYSQIKANWDVASDDQKKKYIEWQDTMDTWAIQSGDANAKSNMFSRIFGDEADGNFAKVRDQIAEIKAEIKDAQESGDEDALEKAMAKLDGFQLEGLLSDEDVSRIREMGAYLYEAEDYLTDLVKAETDFVDVGLYDVAVDINKITEGLESLKSAFDEIIERGKLTSKTIGDLYKEFEEFNNTEDGQKSWLAYSNTVFSGASSIEQMTQATEKYVKSYLDWALKSNNLTPENKWTYIVELQGLGVENAQDYVEEMLTKSLASSLEDKLVDGKISEDAKKEVMERYGVEEEAIKQVIDLLEQKYVAQQKVNEATKPQTAYDEFLNGQNGQKGYKQYLEDMQELAEFNAAEWKYKGDAWTGTYYQNERTGATMTPTEYSTWRAENADKIQSRANLSVYFNEFKKQYANYFDENGELKAEVAVEIQANINNAQAEVDRIQGEIDELAPPEIQLELNLQNFDEGVDKIQDVYSTLKGITTEYNTQGHLSLDNLQALLNLQPEYLAVLKMEGGQLTINQQALEAMLQTKLADAEATAVQTAITQLNALAERKQAIEISNSAMAANQAAIELDTYSGALGTVATDAIIAAGSVAAFNAALQGAQGNTLVSDEEINQILANFNNSVNLIDSVRNNLSSSFNDILDPGSQTSPEEVADNRWEQLLAKYENELALITNERDLIQAEIDKAEADGSKASEMYYRRLIELNDAEKEKLEEKRVALEQYLAANESTIDQDKWTEINNEINDTALAIKECETNTVEWQQALRDIDAHYFSQITDEISRLGEELEFVNGLLEDEDVVGEDGEWSEAALTRIGLYTQLMEKAAAEAKLYQDEIDKLNAQYEDGELSEEQYQEKLSELTSGLHGSIDAYEDAKDGIVELNRARIDEIRDGIDKEIEAYEDLISLKKDELDAERDLYDFKKGVQKQTKDLAALERRIAALSGSTNASDIAERRRLEAERLQAQEDLNDAYYDRARDQQSQALDDEAEAFSKSKEKYIEELEEQLENVEKIISDSIMDALTNADTILAQLNEIATTYGINLSPALTQPWEDAAEKTDAYWENAKSSIEQYADFLTSSELNNNISNTMTSLGDHIQDIIDKWDGVKKAADAAASAQTTAIAIKTPDSVGGSGSSGGSGSGSGGSGSSQANPNVAALQEVLNTVFGANLEADGKFGSKTTAALKKAQEKIGVSADGAYGPLTRNGIISYIDKQVAAWRSSAGSSSMVGQGIEAYLKAKNKLPAPFAKGTLGTNKDQWAYTDEPWLGDELVLIPGANGNLQYMRKGTAVMPADISANLVEWGKLDPGMLKIGAGTGVNIISNAINKPEINLSFDALVKAERIDEGTLPEVKRFVQQEMNNLVKQMNYSLKGHGGR